MKWIKRDGFNVLNGSLKPLYVPENCDSNSPEFTQFLELLQIQSIEEFQSDIEAATESPQLKARLLSVLPYLALLIEKKTYKSADAECFRMKDILAGTTFYSASAIYLSLVFQGETHRGQAMNVFQDGNGALYFKGSWRSPLTIFNLLRELSSLLKITGLNEELRVLLELPVGEIPAWLLDIGVPAEKLALVHTWIGHANPDTAAQQEAGFEENDILVDTEIFDVIDDNYEQSFSPEVSASEIDLGSVPINTRTFSPTFQSPVVSHSEIKDQGVRFEVGRWSEELVYSFFINNRADFSNVEWQNKDGESGKPYDFKVVHLGVEKYIEVKGTPSSTKNIIYMSRNEWQLMFEQGEKYEIYRVISAGTTASVKIDILTNPSGKIKLGELMPTPIQLQV